MLASRLFKTALQSCKNCQVQRSFRTTASNKAIPPILVLFAKPLSRVAAALVGRSARAWWRRLPSDKKLEVRGRILSHRKKIAFTGASFIGGLVYAYESHIQECPVTGRRRFVALYPDQAKRISQEEFNNLLQENENCIIPSNNHLYERVVRVSNQLLKGNRDLRQIYDKSWTVTVIDQPVKNAFVLPSGNIFVYKGMLDFCINDDQLAVILGHEMAHAVLGHIPEKLTMASFVQLVLLVPMAVIWAIVPNDGIALITDWFINKVVEIFSELPFDRAMEMEADEVGLMMAAKACFDVREAPAVWQVMELISDDPMEKDKDWEFLSTHPVHNTRYQSLSGQLTSALNLRMNCGCKKLDPNCDPQIFVKSFEQYLNRQKPGPNAPLYSELKLK